MAIFSAIPNRPCKISLICRLEITAVCARILIRFISDFITKKRLRWTSHIAMKSKVVSSARAQTTDTNRALKFVACVAGLAGGLVGARRQNLAAKLLSRAAEYLTLAINAECGGVRWQYV